MSALDRLVWVLLAAVALGGCRGQEGQDPPIVPIRNMYQQARYNPQARSEFFADGRTMRPLPAGTVAREMEPDLVLVTGRTDDGWVLEVPPPVVDRAGGMDALLARGRSRYDIYCAACHGLTADGNGTVAVRAAAVGGAALRPPTLHDDRLRHMPDGHYFGVIANGVRNMPAYGYVIPLEDRWAIVAYVRALQLSQASAPTAMNMEASP